MTRRRLDLELVARGLAATRAQAQQAITSGRVLVAGSPATKPSALVSPAEAVTLAGDPPRFVSRGGEKLAGALAELRIEAAGRRCLDVGAGTGGFTDCLLAAGAREVVALDVGYGQLDLRLREDPRVRVLERTNVRTADLGKLGGPFELVAADLSFISLVLAADTIVRAAAPGADLLLLVKPQFEAGRREAARGGGVIRDPALWERAVAKVAGALAERGFGTAGVVPSLPPGASGNREFFLWARRDAAAPAEAAIRAAVARAS